LSLWPEATVQFALPGFNAFGPIGSLIVVPESSTALLFGLGLGGIAAKRRRLV
jgi:hypothetical protein